MIKIEVYPVEDNIDKVNIVRDFVLPDISRAKEIITKSIFGNPLNNGFVKEDTDLSIISKVTVRGNMYQQDPHRATIDYRVFLNDRKSPIILHLHLIRYLGILDDFPFFEDKHTKELLKKGVNTPKLLVLLYHEFGHLLDALNPSFGYDKNLMQEIIDAGKHCNLYHLWNGYINRRLFERLGENYLLPYKFCNEIDRITFESDLDYTFDQLVKMTSDFDNQ